jgi:hypothetical protein
MSGQPPGYYLRVDGSFFLPWEDPLMSVGLAPFFRGALGGLTVSNDIAAPNTTIDVASGACTSDARLTPQIMQIMSPITKNTTGTWVAGTGGPGLDTGTVQPNTWYHVFAIERIDTWYSDILISASPTNPILPSPYTTQRRIWSLLTDSSGNIRPFTQFGDQCLWLTPVSNLGTIGGSGFSGPPTTEYLATVTVPTGVKVIAKCCATLINVVSSNSVLLYSPDMGAQVCVDPGMSSLTASVITSSGYASAICDVRTNTSGQIACTSAAAGNIFWLSTLGYTDYRGRYD